MEDCRRDGVWNACETRERTEKDQTGDHSITKGIFKVPKGGTQIQDRSQSLESQDDNRKERCPEIDGFHKQTHRIYRSHTTAAYFRPHTQLLTLSKTRILDGCARKIKVLDYFMLLNNELYSSTLKTVIENS